MALTKTLEISVVGTSLALTYSDFSGQKLPTEYYPICGIKSIKGVPVIGHGTRDSQNQRKNSYPFDDMLQVIIEMDKKENSIIFDIQSVTNQAGWTPNLAGLIQATTDINTWAGDCGCCADSEILLQEIIDELVTIDADLDSIIKEEDAAHVSGDKGVMALAVRNAGLTDLTSTERDYSPIAVDAKGRPIVTGNTGGFTGFTEINMTLDTAIYASGDVLTDTATLGVILRSSGGTGIIHSITLLDEDHQGQPLDIVFFRTNVSLGTKNAAVSISDANAREILGVVRIESSDYVDLVNSYVATKTNLGIGVKGDGIDQIYVSMISRGTGTYTSAGISLMTTVLQD